MLTRSELMNANNILDFSDVKVLVIGDIMLDKHIRGIVQRLNPESPVPLIDVHEEEYAPGGAANVATNIASLGGEVFLIGVIGQDNSGEVLVDELRQRDVNTDYIVVQEDIPTIFKVRAYAQHQQLIRFDYEKKDSINSNTFQRIFSNLDDIVPEIDIIVISDYAKGLITHEIMNKLKTYGKKIIVDPKPKHKDMYKNVFLIKPNAKEACEMAGVNYEVGIDYNNIGNVLRSKFNSNILISLGAEGMALFKLDNGYIKLDTEAKDVFDVTGAGDTVIATLALCIAKGYKLEDAAKIANKAAGIVVGKVGTSTVTVEEIANIL